MSDEKRRSIRVELTPEQKTQIKAAFGKDVSTLELDERALEERVSPSMLGSIG